MKNLKSKLLIIMLSLMLSLTGLLFVNNKQEEVYAASFDDINHSGGTGFNAESITWAEYDDYKNSVINLYDNGSDTLNHYNVKIHTSSSNKPASASRKFEGSKLYLAFGGWLVKNSVSYTVDTTITLPSYIVGNPNFTIKLATSSCSATAKINDSESLEFTGSQISSPNIKVSFEQSYSGSAATNLAVLEVNSPQIILTTTDIKAPKINFGNDTQTSGGRIINFSVTDDNGSGIKYVKFNGETHTNVSDDSSFSFDAKYDKDYVIEVSDNVGNIYKETISKDNTNPKSPVIKDLKSAIYESQMTFSIEYDKDTTPHASPEKLYYAIVSLTDYKAGNYLLDNTCASLSAGTNTISLSGLSNGTYKLLVLAIDDAGNTCDQVAMSEFEYDTTLYTLTLPQLIGGRYTSVKIADEEYYEEGKTEYTLYYKQSVTISYIAEEGYKFYDIVMDDRYLGLNSDSYATSYSLDYSKQLSIDIKFRYIVDISIDSNYTFESSEDTNYNNLISSLQVFGRTDRVLDNKIVELEVYNSNNELVAKYNNNDSDLNLVGKFYNADTYRVVWNIVEDEEYLFVANSHELFVTIDKKVISGITYSGFDNLIYSGNEYNVLFDLGTANLDDDEIINLAPNITISYYLVEDIECLNPVKLVSAGKYFAVLSIINDNYTLANKIAIDEITIAKKDVSVEIIRDTFTYNEQVQSIELALSDNSIPLDEVIVTYYNANDNTQTSYLVAGKYTYVLELSSNYSNNYNLTNTTGQCEIEVSKVYFRLNKTQYDYTDSIISLDYTVLAYGVDGEVEICSINNVFSYTSYIILDGNKTECLLKNKGLYSISFMTSDSNYELYEYTFENIEIKQTKIKIEIVKNYEFNGNNQQFRYVYKNENNEILENLVGISVTLLDSEGNIVDYMLGVGEYSYSFVINPKFEISDESDDLTGTVTMTPAIITIDIPNSYEYLPNTNGVENIDYYNIEYSLVSLNNVDFANLGFITFTIDRLDSTKAWGSVGKYLYTITSNNENVKFQLADGVASDYSGEIEIVSRNIYINVTNTYEYSNSDIAIEYSIVDNYGLNLDDLVVSYDTMRNVGKYLYTITCNDSNYIIVISNGLQNESGMYYVEITPKAITIEEITTSYTYTGENIDINLNLSNPYNENIEYVINRRLNGQIIENIVNAGSYSVEIISNSNNYVINHDYIEIVVLPKALRVQVLDTITAIYNGQVQTIEYSFLDEEDNICEVLSTVKFTLDNFDNIIEPKNVGKYSYKIVLVGGNYRIVDTIGTFEILPAQLNVVPLANQGKIYGSEDGVIEYTLEGLIDGDEVEVTLNRTSGENVGIYYITYVSGANSNANYNVNFKDNYYMYEIAPKKLMIIADKMSKQFGQEDSSLTYKMYMSGMYVTELLNNDSLGGSLIREDGENVGVYDILLGTLSNDNYQITFVKNTYTITPKTLHITLDNITTTYGDDVELTYSSKEDFVSEYIFGAITREEGRNVGDYTISRGTLDSNNYNLIIENGVYTILPREISVSANPYKKTYGEVDNLTYAVSGLIGNDTLSGSLTREEGENVGEYQILLGTLHNDNYTINYTSNILTIGKAKLNIKFDDKTQVYGENPTPLTVQVLGLIGEDKLDIKLFRESGDNVGVYEITGAFSIPANYMVESFTPGKYTIEKARIVPTLLSKKVIYNGKAQSLDTDNFGFDLQFIYKLNGFRVDECIDAGTYTVQAEFAGNNNYYPAKSKEATLIIEKQFVFISLTSCEFIYDGAIKYPEFSYDKNIGIDENAFTFKFENDIFPQEVGLYNFAIIISDNNFEGQTQGVVKVQKALTTTNDKASIVECEEATFDEDVQNVKLVQNSDTKKFNNEKVLSVCSLENIGENANGYIYTVKVKATAGVENVKVYKVGLSGFSQQAIKIEDGYYVFKIDDPNDKYIITTEIKTLSTLAWILILVAVVLIFVVALIIVSKKKHKKVKVSKVSDKDIETYNVN